MRSCDPLWRGCHLEPKRILLITKPRYIGDSVLATPAMRSLADRYPHAAMDLLTGGAAAEVMRGLPFLALIEVVQHERRRNPGELLRTAAALRSRNYDVAVLFDRSIRSALLAFLARIPVRVGFSVEFRRPLLSIPVPYSRSEPELDSLLRLSTAAGAQTTTRTPELTVGKPEITDAMRKFDLRPPLVIMAPAANEPHLRQWPARHFAETANALAKDGMTIVLVGAQTEQDVALEVRQGCPEAVNLAGKTSIRECLALIAASDLFVSGEIGLSHCAAGLRTPCVTIHNPKKIARWSHENEISVALSHPAPCEHPTPNQLQACLAAVTPHQVLDAASRVRRKSQAIVT